MPETPVAVTEEVREARISEIRARQEEIDKEFTGLVFPEAIRTEFEQLAAERKEHEEAIEEFRARREYLGRLADTEANREDGAPFQTRRPGFSGDDIYDLTSVRSSVSNPAAAVDEMRERAKRSIDAAQFPHERANREDCQAHLERQLETVQVPLHDQGAFSRHLLQTGSPIYKRAFGKSLLGQPLSGDEQRSLSLGGSGGADGGFAVPYTLDPTIIPTGNGSVNPYRAISRVEQIAGSNEWRGVSAGEITATRRAEDAEVGDNAPTLAQPTAAVTRVDAFIPFSREIGQDWNGLQAEMAKLIQDAKDNEEATSFTTGAGTGVNPQGVITGATNVQTTAGSGLFAVADVYATEQALPPKFRPMAQWVANRATYNRVRQFDTQGGAQIWTENLQKGLQNQVPTPGNIGYRLLGYPANEASVMASTLANGALIAVLGDFRYYLIVDRIGLSLEFVPHLFHTSNNRPTGQSGLLAIWRNTGKVLSAAAFRVTKVQ